MKSYQGAGSRSHSLVPGRGIEGREFIVGLDLVACVYGNGFRKRGESLPVFN
ncbi:MAG: hypothetical protein M1368_11170 [Thaumarchaeota archaeon]|nr:hypothetical protein [Nitrososphaerota archaeon]